jgi:DNA repair exonuclease SbcCD ATPase subunit
MAKKSDILSIYFKNITEFNNDYQSRLMNLRRDFDNEKLSYQTLLDQICNEFNDTNSDKFNEYNYLELKHQTQMDLIDNEYRERFTELDKRLKANIDSLNQRIEEENKTFEDVLQQFDERKQEALNKYLELIHENDQKIEESIAVHREFISEEDIKLEATKDYLQGINSFLANDLLNIMEKARNSLDSLQENLKEANINDGKEFNQTILKSLENLRGIQIGIISLFKDNSGELEQKREHIKSISRNKQQPHSQLNQKLIEQYVKQIREVNSNKVYFEAKVKADLDVSLAKVHQRILKADKDKNQSDLRKYISQKEIIEKKANYLLHRNKTLSAFTVRKYQQEIKKIKIDSFKRSEEIKLAYSIPIIFLQNSIDTYSNFAFYLNQSFDELDRLLTNFIDFNQDFLELKSDFVKNTSKAYEDYKINLLVRVNDVATNLSKLISRIDEISFEIVTLESHNQIEIAEVRKKLENLEVLSDYQKYLASLENDEFFAMYQHSKNIERIQLDY